MTIPSVWRALVAVGLLGALTAPVAPRPAPGAPLALHLPDVTLEAGGEPARQEPYVDTATAVTLGAAEVEFDFGRASGVATVAAPAATADWRACVPAPGRLTCTLAPGWVVDAADGALPDITVTASPGAPVGATGTIRVTLTDPVHGRATTTARVRVDDDVDLVAGVERRADAAVGASFVRTVSVRNAGPRPVDGVVAVFDNGSGVTDDDTDYRNCRYDADGRLLRCLFDTVLAPGRAYRARLPMRVTDRAFAPGTQHSAVTWLSRRAAATTADPGPDGGSGAGADGTGEPGGDAPLVLRPASGFTAVPADVDPPGTAVQQVHVTGSNSADVVVRGSTAVATPGATADLTMSVTNHGPADLANADDARAVAAVDVTLPAGVTALAAPTGCEEVDEAVWRCYAQASELPANGVERWTFRVRVNRVVADGAGEVALAHDEWVALAADLRRENNAAPLVVSG